jgi:predicted transcriptional regulator
MPTSVQIIAARALLELGQRELAKLAGVHLSTVVRLEAAGWKVAPANARTLERVLDIFESKHVEFIENGVRLTRKPRR